MWFDKLVSMFNNSAWFQYWEEFYKHIFNNYKFLDRFVFCTLVLFICHKTFPKSFGRIPILPVILLSAYLLCNSYWAAFVTILLQVFFVIKVSSYYIQKINTKKIKSVQRIPEKLYKIDFTEDGQMISAVVEKSK